MVVSMNVKTVLLITTTLSIFSFNAIAVKQEANQAKKPPLIIKSQVKGSQQQPKVIYIMPWQGINKPVSISEHQRQARLPSFQPIHPKAFRKQVEQFHHNNKAMQQ
mgnify:CR=1 FL=1